MISVIIPLYNTGGYIGECLDSILAQSYGDYECIVVDDGSTDNGGRIADSFALRDSRFKIYHTENRGVSAARNLGLEKARGEFVVFVDSDDTVEKNHLSSLAGNCKDGIDLIVAGVRKFRVGDTIDIFKPKAPGEMFISERFIDEYSENMGLFHGPVAKLFRASIISHNNIRFNEALNIGEDLCFNLDYLASAGKIRLIEYVDYNYRAMDSSLSNRASYPFEGLYHAWSYHKAFLVSKCMWRQKAADRMYRQLGGYLYDALFTAESQTVFQNCLLLLSNEELNGCLSHFNYPRWFRFFISSRLPGLAWKAIKISRKRYGGIR